MRGEFDRVPPLNDEATAIAEASGDGTAIVMSFAAAHEVALLRGSTADLPAGYPAALENAPPDVLTECLLGTLLALTDRLPEPSRSTGGSSRSTPASTGGRARP